MSIFPPDPDFYEELSVHQCLELLQGATPLVLIDCREANEYAFCRIERAVLVPLSSFAGAAEAHLPDKDGITIIYCHHGVRSLNAMHYLRQQGYRYCYSMRGGIDQWSHLIDPSVPTYYRACPKNWIHSGSKDCVC